MLVPSQGLAHPKSYFKEYEDSHQRSAEERNNKHHSPRGNSAQGPEEVANGDSDTILSKLAIKGMEPAAVLKLAPALLVTGDVGINNFLSGDGGEIQALDENISLSRGGEDIKSPENTGGSRPAVAENRLIVAVDVSEMRRLGELSELEGCITVCGFDLVAVACLKGRLACSA